MSKCSDGYKDFNRVSYAVPTPSAILAVWGRVLFSGCAPNACFFLELWPRNVKKKLQNTGNRKMTRNTAALIYEIQIHTL